MTPFDTLAANYSELWSATPAGLEQRHQVWREIENLFSAGQHVLDLGCGIGDDAMHLQSRGVRVTAIDASHEMIGIAQRRGVDARHFSIEQLACLDGTFDGALSNFAAFNCIAEPDRAARDLSRLLHPGSYFAMCVLSRFYWQESLALNFRRWSGHTMWRGLAIHYPTSRAWRRAFAPHFTLQRRIAIGGGDHTLYLWKRS